MSRPQKPRSQKIGPFAIIPRLLAAVLLLPNWAVADVRMTDLIVRDRILHTHPDELTEEALPIVHDCPQVAATIRAEDMTEDELATACIVLNRTEDHYHTKLGTDPANPVMDWNDTLEILMFSRRENMNEYYAAAFGRELTAAGVYAGWTEKEEVRPWMILSFSRSRFEEISQAYFVDPAENDAWNLLKHEYIHHLDSTHHQNASCVHLEGVAEYFAAFTDNTDVPNYGYWLRLIGNGSNLPSLLSAWNYPSLVDAGINPVDANYGWGYLTVRFFFEEHPQVMLDLYDIASRISRHDDCWRLRAVYASEAFPSLAEDFERWLKEFVAIKSVQQIEPITLFLASDENGNPLYHPLHQTLADKWPPEDYAGFRILRTFSYFQSSSQDDFTVSVSFSDSAIENVVDIYANWSKVSLYAVGTGAVEVTLTVTTPDGNSAQQTFMVTVVNDLQSKEVVVRDPLSIEEDYLSVDLSMYFTGPALEDVEFFAASSNPDVAPVSLDGGRLVITASSVGEAQITVRGDYLGRVEERTFTISVTDECPRWLCRGTLTGWRSALLPTAETSDTQTTGRR